MRLEQKVVQWLVLLHDGVSLGALMCFTLYAISGAVLADPMCGSGTLLIEAALQATATAPGLFRRRWPFQHWPDFEPRHWRACVAEAEASRRTWRGAILGNDIHPGALSLAAKCAQYQPPACHRHCAYIALRMQRALSLAAKSGSCFSFHPGLP
jgi:hypothetical protein